MGFALPPVVAVAPAWYSKYNKVANIPKKPSSTANDTAGATHMYPLPAGQGFGGGGVADGVVTTVVDVGLEVCTEFPLGVDVGAGAGTVGAVAEVEVGVEPGPGVASFEAT